MYVCISYVVYILIVCRSLKKKKKKIVIDLYEKLKYNIGEGNSIRGYIPF